MITEEQRIERRNFLGSSDISALFTDAEGRSLDPFKTIYDVWAQKVFDSEAPPEEKKSMKRGNRYESALIKFAEEELGVDIETDPDKMRFICPTVPFFASNLDGYTKEDKPCIVEAKTTSMTGEWGEDGDQIPYRVILQTHMQMICCGMDKAHVVVLLGKWGLDEKLYLVERNEAVINAIIKRGTWFWNEHVLTKIAPPDSAPGNIEFLKKIRRIPAKYADYKENVIEEWEVAKKVRSDAEKNEDAKFAEVLACLGDAEGITMPDGRELVYFKQNGAPKVDRKLLESAYPDVYKAVVTPTEHRTARIRTIK